MYVYRQREGLAPLFLVSQRKVVVFVGEIYRFYCPVCNERPDEAFSSMNTRNIWPDRPAGRALGCGLNYPNVCKILYRKIRRGDFGPKARGTLRWMLKPGIYHQRAVFVCEDCGGWRIEDDVKICKTKPGKKHPRGSFTDRKREAAAGPWLRPMCYVNESVYDVVWEAEYRCPCGGRMGPVRMPYRLKCNNCHNSLEVTMMGTWD